VNITGPKKNILFSIKVYYNIKKKYSNVLRVQDINASCFEIYSKGVPVHAMKTYREVRGIAPLVLKLGTT
jgi:hypothetical protein